MDKHQILEPVQPVVEAGPSYRRVSRALSGNKSEENMPIEEADRMIIFGPVPSRRLGRSLEGLKERFIAENA